MQYTTSIMGDVGVGEPKIVATPVVDLPTSNIPLASALNTYSHDLRVHHRGRVLWGPGSWQDRTPDSSGLGQDRTQVRSFGVRVRVQDASSRVLGPDSVNTKRDGTCSVHVLETPAHPYESSLSAQQTSLVLGGRKSFRITDASLYSQVFSHYNTLLAPNEQLYRDYSSAVPWTQSTLAELRCCHPSHLGRASYHPLIPDPKPEHRLKSNSDSPRGDRKVEGWRTCRSIRPKAMRVTIGAAYPNQLA